MSDLLPPATQRFIADAEGFVAGLDPAIEAAKKFADRNDDAALAARRMALAAAESAAAAGAAQREAADAAQKLRDAELEAAEAQDMAEEAAHKLERGEIPAAEAQKLAADAAEKIARVSTEAAAAQELEAAAARKLERAQLAAAAAQKAVASAGTGEEPGGISAFITKILGAGGDMGGMDALTGPGGIIAGIASLPTLLGGATVALGGLETAMLAIPGAVGVAGGALATLKLALSGVSSAISAGWSGNWAQFSKDLKGLAPAARTFAKEVVGLKGPIDSLKKDVQQSFFAGWSKDVGKLGDTLIPQLDRGLTKVAGSLGKVAKETVDWLGKSQTAARIQHILSGVAGVFGRLSKAVQPVLDVFSRLADSSIGDLFKPLAGYVAKAAEGFDKFVKNAQRSGELKQAFTNLLQIVKSFGKPLGDLAKGILKAFATKDGQRSIQQLGSALDKLVKDVVPHLPQFVKTFGDVMHVLNNVAPAAAGLFVLLDALAKIDSFMITKFWPGVVKVVKDVINWFKKLPHDAEAGLNTLKSLPGKVIGWLQSLPGKLGKLGQEALNKMAYAVGYGLGTVYKLFKEMPGKALAFWESLPGRIKKLWTTAMDDERQVVTQGIADVVKIFRDAPGKVYSALQSVPGKVRSALSQAVGVARSVGRNIVAGLINGLGSMAGGLINEARSLASSVVSGFKSALHIGSPSKVMADEVGAMIPAGIAQGIKGNLGGVLEAARSMATSVVGAAQPNLAGYGGYAGIAAAGTGGGVTIVVQGSIVDTQGLFRAVQTATLRHNVRNPVNGLSLTGKGRTT